MAKNYSPGLHAFFKDVDTKLKRTPIGGVQVGRLTYHPHLDTRMRRIKIPTHLRAKRPGI